tara:strand:- start:52 stop:345 length:294 start_codon:yes stop_codon:yes gene_type:complete
LLIKAVECKNCGDVIYSRADEDFRKCSCGSVEVTGGHMHFKHYTIPGANYEIKKVDVDISLDKLYNDWYDMNDVYGLIKSEEDNTNRSENGAIQENI